RAMPGSSRVQAIRPQTRRSSHGHRELYSCERTAHGAKPPERNEVVSSRAEPCDGAFCAGVNLKANMRLVCVNAMLCCLWISAAAGCAASPAGSATGEISVNLKGTVPSGVIYRLRNAVITVDGPSSAEFRTEDDPDRTSLSANVVVGDYTAVL